LSDCLASKAALLPLTTTASITFNPDHTLSDDEVESAAGTISVQTSWCLPAGSQCSELNANLTHPGALGSVVTESATCTAQGGGCTCEVSRKQAIAQKMTYSTAGPTLTLNYSDGAVTFGYCVRGTELDFLDPNAFFAGRDTSTIYTAYIKQ
jgi:hypothetical protein